MRIEVGNAWEKSATNPDGQKNGWFMGSSRFIKEASLRQCEDLELKWSVHPKGFDSGAKSCAPDVGISILVEGHFLIGFRNGPNEAWQEYRLENRGDFLISHGGSQHRYRAIEDCTLLTIRLTRAGNKRLAT